jgi:TolB protein
MLLIPMFQLSAQSVTNNAFAVWSPDGEFIYFVSDRDGDSDVWRMQSDGSDLQNLTADDLDDNGTIAISPDNQFLAYTSTRVEDDILMSDLWLMSLQDDITINISALLPDDVVASGSPAWSPDGETVAFLATTEDRRDIVIYELAGETVNNLTEDIDREPAFAFAWKQDGTGFLTSFLRMPEEAPVLWQLSLTDRAITPFIPDLDDLTGCEFPVINKIVLSPKAEHFVMEIFCRAWDDKTKLFLVQMDDKTTILLTDEQPVSTGLNPAWSPDGSQIAFNTSPTGSESDVYVLDITDDALQVNLTADIPGTATRPAWSPGDEHILFQTNVAGKLEIWQVSPGGTNSQPLPLPE